MVLVVPRARPKYSAVILGQDGSTEPRRARRFDQRSIHDLESNCPGRASIGVDRRALVQNFTFNGPDVQSVLTRAPILVGEIPEGIRYCGAQLHADKCGYNGSRIVARGNPAQTRPMTVGSTAVSSDASRSDSTSGFAEPHHTPPTPPLYLRLDARRWLRSLR